MLLFVAIRGDALGVSPGGIPGGVSPGGIPGRYPQGESPGMIPWRDHLGFSPGVIPGSYDDHGFGGFPRGVVWGVPLEDPVKKITWGEPLPCSPGGFRG